ncbi:MAG: 3D domain-containing protein [Verrucomicrobiales bacterium]|nr:3D domain-containing protein [Verrucomicrobiales bacterium]
MMVAFALCSCSAAKVAGNSIPVKKAGSVIYKVKTTAYSHTEKDSLKYGRGSATGNALMYGKVRSAAADWSIFPMGTVFRILGESNTYVVDDYGSALVGTKTIDLYRPSKSEMSKWGARNVHIEILRWGSFDQSLKILSERRKHSHVRAMYANILKNKGSKS